MSGSLFVTLSGYTWPLELPGLVRVGGLQISSDDTGFDLRLPTLGAIGDWGLMTNRRLGLPALATVGGGLYVAVAAVTELSLPALTSVGGELALASAVTELSLPALESVGRLAIDGAALTELSLPSLTTVVSHLEISRNPELTSIRLPALTCVGGFLIIEGDVASIALPTLASVDGSVIISYNLALTELDLPMLTTVGGILDLSHNAALSALELPVLTIVGERLGPGDDERYNRGLFLGDTALTELDLPALTAVSGDLNILETRFLTRIRVPRLASVGELTIADNAALTELSLPALATVSDGAVSAVYILRNHALVSISLPVLVKVDVAVWIGLTTFESGGNLALTELNLASLRDVRDWLFISGNTALCQSTVDAILARVGTPYEVIVSGNRDGC